MQIETGFPLARLTTIGTGGPAAALARPSSLAELEEALAWAAERGLGVVTVGLGSNLLAADEGVDALVLRLEGDLAAVEIDGELLRAGGGATNAVCLHRARAAGLGGLEFACAIPGTAGGGVRMNAGAYGSDWSAILERALVVSRRRERMAHPRRARPLVPPLGARAPARSWRASSTASRRGRSSEIKAEVAELVARRKATQPTNKRTFGSVFKNPPGELGAGRMLERVRAQGATGSAAPSSRRGTRTSSRTPTARPRPTASP